VYRSSVCIDEIRKKKTLLHRNLKTLKGEAKGKMESCEEVLIFFINEEDNPIQTCICTISGKS
jgi:hypothetical protein